MKQKTRKVYTIMVVPNARGKYRSFSVSGTFIKGFFISIVVFLFGALFLFKDYVDMSKKVYETKQLRRVASEQKIQIQNFSRAIKNLEVKMAKLQTLDKKLRIITSLERRPEDKSAMTGVGGPTELNDMSTSSKEEQSGMIQGMQEDLKQLQTDAYQQELSFLELEGYLRDQKSLLASTPSIWPTRGWLTSGFGYRKSPFTGRREMHNGLDIATRMGTNVVASADGVVVKSNVVPGLGKVVVLDHGYGFQTVYGHNSRVLVKVGQKVKRWQTIALVGSTGRSTGPHVHYEVRINGIPVDPLRYIVN
jgi:murein DD-endopeptidase MepM/ murein hydrolase activator NlpD